MKPCTSIEDGVRAVLEIYNWDEIVFWQYLPAEGEALCDRVRIGDEIYPLFWWRADTQIEQLRRMAPERELCSMKLNRTCTKEEGLERLMYREFDVAEQMLGCKIQKLMCYGGDSALCMLATMEQQQVAVFELAAVLNENTPEQGRHTYWGKNGMASDRVVSQKVASDAVYLFTEGEEKAETYNDIFLYMYGLDKLQATKAETIAEMLMGRMDYSDWKELDKHYRNCIRAAEESAAKGVRVTVEG